MVSQTGEFPGLAAGSPFRGLALLTVVSKMVVPVLP